MCVEKKLERAIENILFRSRIEEETNQLENSKDNYLGKIVTEKLLEIIPRDHIIINESYSPHLTNFRPNSKSKDLQTSLRKIPRTLKNDKIRHFGIK